MMEDDDAIDFAAMVIFRRKNTCEISTENYVPCSFELKNDLIFRICAIRMNPFTHPFDRCIFQDYELNRFLRI
jgi:hypothetical protein